MSGFSKFIEQAVTDAGFTNIDLRAHIDGSTPPPGQKKKLYDIAKNIEILNTGDNPIIFKIERPGDDSSTDAEWTGNYIDTKNAVNIAWGDDEVYQLPITIQAKAVTGSSQITINLNDFLTIFED